MSKSKPSNNIKVAVRLRPFNSREKKKGCKLIMDMTDDGSVILDMTSEGKGSKKFNFDFAFWSFDGSRKRASQDTLYENLGFFVPEALNGYNCSIFAYGQTGAGKSYSMMGPVDDPGIIYRGLQDFFKKKQEVSDGSRIELEVSFLEIYNEQVGDLLNKKEAKKLKVRVDKKKGVYVQGLSIKAVASFEQAKFLIDLGFNSRSVASTKMNATSSRSHCIFTMYIKKFGMNDKGEARVLTEAKVNLIDLAGSERQGKTGATGARLKEANAINQSLSALGNVISALAKRGKFVPYRSSVLTLLLRESLGGNSKTIMVCAISPADDNLKETWSTLRYASRVKAITNKVKKNESEDPSVVIAKLKQTIKGLKEQIKTSGDAPGKGKIVLNDELAHLEAEMARMDKSHEERCQELQKDVEEQNNELKSLGLVGLLQIEADENTPRLINISPDPMMSGRLMYFLEKQNEDFVIGTKKRDDEKDSRIVLLCTKTSNVQEEHATIKVSAKTVTLKPNNPETCQLFVNGMRVREQINIFHSDRIVFGTGQVCFHFLSPKHPSTNPASSVEVDYEEIARELHEKDEEVMKLKEQLRTERSKHEAKAMLVDSIRQSMEVKLKEMMTEESKLRLKLQDELNDLKAGGKLKRTHSCNSDDPNKKLPEMQNDLAARLNDRKKSRIALQRRISHKTKLFDQRKQFDKEAEEQLRKAVTLCRLSDAMAKLNGIDSRYSTITIPFWEGESGLPDDKVMILETYHVDNTYIANMYDYDSFVERHEDQAEWESRDKSKISVNPFVPDMPTHIIGCAHIKDTGLSLKSHEYAIEAFGGGERGKINAWLDIDQDDEGVRLP